MIFYLACILSGYLIQRITKSKWSYLLTPIAALLASLIIFVGVYIVSLLTGHKSGGTVTLVEMTLSSLFGALYVAFALWYFRSKNTQALLLMICFGFYAIALPTLLFSLKENFSFLSDVQTRGKIFYSSLYSMCGCILASLILLVSKSTEKDISYRVVAFLLFSLCPLAVRFLDSNLYITHGELTSFWIQVNTLSYTSMLFLTVPVSVALTFVIWKSDLQIKASDTINGV
jgi:hypothetical protein